MTVTVWAAWIMQIAMSFSDGIIDYEILAVAWNSKCWSSMTLDAFLCSVTRDTGIKPCVVDAT